jgi:GNAT superfamily N-acetyltransferase
MFDDMFAAYDAKKAPMETFYDGYVVNDDTVAVLVDQAINQANAGADIIAHCTRNSSVHKFAGWAGDHASVVSLATHPEGDAPVGYSVITTTDLPLPPQPGDVELRRIYALSITRGTGLGHRLMAQAINDARALGGKRLLLGVLAAIIVAWFSRQREFRADAGAAGLMGRKQPMINALARLGGIDPGEMPKAMQAMGISSRPSGLMALFSTHPPMEERIARLRESA